MDLLPDRSFVQSPGTCIVCENAPDEGTPVVDTGRNLTLGIPSLDGRKYVCFSCAQAVANAIGFVSDEAEQAAKAEAAAVALELDAFKQRANAVFDAFNSPYEEPFQAPAVVEEVVEDLDVAVYESPAEGEVAVEDEPEVDVEDDEV